MSLLLRLIKYGGNQVQVTVTIVYYICDWVEHGRCTVIGGTWLVVI